MTLQLSYRDKWYSLLLFSSRSFSFQTYYGLAINLQILPVQHNNKKMKQNDKKVNAKKASMQDTSRFICGLFSHVNVAIHCSVIFSLTFLRHFSTAKIRNYRKTKPLKRMAFNKKDKKKVENLHFPSR